MKSPILRLKALLIMIFTGLFATTAIGDEAESSPRETFVAYFRAMGARQDDIGQALKAPDCADSLHMNIDKLNIVDRLQPFYELSTTNRALVVANPFTILSTVLDRDEVIYAELLKLSGKWRIRKLSLTSPENASWLMKGFQIHPDVNLDLSPQALVGEWRYPCSSTIVLEADGTGSDLAIGPDGPHKDQKPEPFTWDVKGSTLTIRLADRVHQLTVTSIDHGEMFFKTAGGALWSSWRRKSPAKQTGADKPAIKPADKVPAKDRPSPPTSKDLPR
jgi:hypothetical protein